jgi:hypothetical protein
MVIDFDTFWDGNDSERKKRAVTAEQVAAWEKRWQVALPTPLPAALQKQDGGLVRYSDVRVLPLGEMAPPPTEFWQDADYPKKDFRDRRLVITFAHGDDGEPHYFLNFNKDRAEQSAGSVTEEAARRRSRTAGQPRGHR